MANGFRIRLIDMAGGVIGIVGWASETVTEGDTVELPDGRPVEVLEVYLPESEIKHAFADIIGEPYVPKDWPGESSDLFSSRLSIAGDPVTVAFAFKGPGQPGKLHLSDMGKRGDQAVRLFQEPADLIVVQHHDMVASAVRNVLSALCRQHGKRFMVIDGATTALILRTYGKLPQH